MSTDKYSILDEARSAATNTGVIGWFVAAFFFGFFALLIVYVRSPKTPVTFLTEYDGEDRHLFDQAYVEALKAKQVRTTWVGLLFGYLVGFFALVLPLCGLMLANT